MLVKIYIFWSHLLSVILYFNQFENISRFYLFIFILKTYLY
jgi:hypothetical protein